MEEREIRFIAEEQWKRNLEWRADPKNAKIVNFTDRVYAELNTLGYNVEWGFTMQPAYFDGDIRIFPIAKKYIEEAFEDKELSSCVNMLIGILGHKKMTVATSYLIEIYRRALKEQADSCILNASGWAILTIKDKRYIDEYISLLADELLVPYTGYFIELLSKLKVHEVEDRLMELMDSRLKPRAIDNAEFFYYIGHDITLVKDSIKALGRLKCKKAIPKIEEYLHPTDLPGFPMNAKDRIKDVSKMAQKALEKINS